MPDDFDSVVADRCREVDDVPVPADLWSRVQIKVVERVPVQFTEEEATIIDRHGENGERDESIELVPSAVEPPTRGRVALSIALAAAAAVLVVALGAVVRTGDEPDPADVPPSTVPTPPTTIPVDLLVGVWLSIDTDGSSQTMEIARSGTDEYDVVIHDEAATAACAGGASTLIGAGRLATDTSLVIAQPELTCDDGTIPPIGPPPQAELASYTLDRDTATGELVDNFGVAWHREGSNVDLNGPTSSGGMWPQSTLAEVLAAQELADAGDPDYTWQVEPELVSEEFEEPGEVELVDRFLREVLGWEAYLLYPAEGTTRNGLYTDLHGQRYLRCAPGRTNPLYPPSPEPPYDLAKWGEECAPTIDELHYESVSIDLAQLDRRGDDGIWVVNRWELREPFAQVDPAVVDVQATGRLEEFLDARVAGQGAEGLVEVLYDPDIDVPLLYATTSGAAYERYEIERVDAWWPSGVGTFRVRMFADGDASVIEQEFFWANGGLRMDDDATIENGQSLVLSHTSSDGEVSVSAPSTWQTWLPGKVDNNGGSPGHAPDVWFGGLWRPEEFFGSGERIEFTDPVAYDAWCAASGGSPLLSAPADAAAIAQQLVADPNFDTTAPVAARIGGVEAVSIDVALAPGGEACGVGVIEISRWIHGLWEPGWRLRLYLVDLPEGMSAPTLAITVVAPDERFDEVIAETAPIIDSIEFHPQSA